ncbi:hypothetical protein AgCh_014722 [Apium graveolens]
MIATIVNKPSIPKPRAEWSDPDIKQVHKDKKVMNILFNGVDGDMFDNIINCKTATEVWDTIQVICDRTEQRCLKLLFSRMHPLSNFPVYLAHIFRVLSRQHCKMDNGKNKGGSFGLTYPMLAKGNYTAWALKMRVFMQAQGVWNAIEAPDPKDEKSDKIALAMIYQGIPEDMLLSIAEKKTAKEGWEAIKVMCQGADRLKKARVQTLKAEFETLRMNDGEQLDDFYMKLNGLVSTIRALGEEMHESYVVKKLLRAVPSRFLQIASTIEQFGDLEKMTVEETVGSLQAHEERLKGQNETAGSKLLLTEEEWSRREKNDTKLLLTRKDWLKRTGNTDGTNNWRGGRGFKGMSRDKSTVRCFNCNMLGHYAADCRRPRRERNQKSEANLVEIKDDEPALLLSELDESKTQMVLLNEEKVIPRLETNPIAKRTSQVWYLDNGASNHMTGDKTKFSTLDEGITGEWVYEKDGRALMKVKRSVNRLYKIMLEESPGACLFTQNTKMEEESWLWHCRLGHVNFNAMSIMKENDMVVGLPRLLQPTEVCKGCLMAKQTRTLFPSQSSYASSKGLELVHGDLCGPISPPTPSRKRYFLLLVDDFSRMMWVFFLSTKDEAFSQILHVK